MKLNVLLDQCYIEFPKDRLNLLVDPNFVYSGVGIYHSCKLSGFLHDLAFCFTDMTQYHNLVSYSEVSGISFHVKELNSWICLENLLNHKPRVLRTLEGILLEELRSTNLSPEFFENYASERNVATLIFKCHDLFTHYMGVREGLRDKFLDNKDFL